MALTRVCLYTRISTDEKNQPTSLHCQRVKFLRQRLGEVLGLLYIRN